MKSTTTYKTILSKMLLTVVLCASVLWLMPGAFAQGVAINTNGAPADASAAFDIQSVTGGLLIPKMSQAQRDDIDLPAIGLLIFQTDGTAGFYYYDGTAWIAVGADETDPVFTVSPSSGITGTNITNWNTAFGWNNHAAAGYLIDETDPTVPAHVKTITNDNVSNWNEAYVWGDHADGGYLTDFTETDPVFTASPSFGINGTNITNWTTAFG